jgi:hypothetical protein
MDATPRTPRYRGAFPPDRMRGSAPSGTADTLRRVKKTSVYLEPDLDEALARRAADEGLTKAEFIRRTLAGAVTRPKRARPRAVGLHDDAPADLAARDEQWLASGGPA